MTQTKMGSDWVRGYGSLLTMSDEDMRNAESEYWARIADAERESE